MEKGKGGGEQGGGTTDPSTSGVASSQEITSAQRHFPKVQLLANHFRIQLNDPSATITRCKVEVQVVKFRMWCGFQVVKSTEKLDPKKRSEMRFVVERLFSQHPVDFPPDNSAYNGSEYIFSANRHDTGDQFRVNIPGKGYYYIIKVVEVDWVELSKVPRYVSGSEPISGKDRDILTQGLDSLMKEIPRRSMIRIRRNFYKKEYESFLYSGAAVHTGFKQSLKLTSQGPALCLDYSAVLFYRTNFLKFLEETVDGFRRPTDLGRYRREVEEASTGLKVQTTHTNIKYTFVGLTPQNTRDLEFDIEKPDGTTVPTKVVNYFQTKHGRDIEYKGIPCLILRRNNVNSYMPIELCKLAEGQMYHNQQLWGINETSVLLPHIRKQVISKTVNDPHGPFSNGVFSENFGIQLTPHMTVVDGGRINPPLLKLTRPGGRPRSVTVNQDRCDWNYSGGNNFAQCKKLHSWALVNLAHVNGRQFIKDLKLRSFELGMVMADPVLFNCYSMDDVSSIGKIKEVVDDVVRECEVGTLQIIIFVITGKFDYYGYLKWFLETKMGVISQCCLQTAYNDGRKKTMFLHNLCMKINGKIGGSNVVLQERLPHFTETDLVMFIGADVNHPAAKDNSSSSIAAVVGTVNWPAANRYVARIKPQECRNETINKFGAMCKHLVNTFSESNEGKKPDKIVVFRDGVGEGQFDMVRKEEIGDLRRAIRTAGCEAKITVVLAQKRHHTRIFRRDDEAENVLPGTVVDTVIVNPSKSNFFLCSHFGAKGTSKPVHYHVLLDENEFPLHDLQKLIYHLCFTSARCTKPISLVPPVYYADLVAKRGRMYYEAAKEESDANPRRGTSDAAASPSSASSANPSLENCCKLHPLVKNTMFFI